MEEYLLKVENLSIRFQTVSGMNDAVVGLSFVLKKNEILGIVGESGSGKSVTSLSIMGLLPERNVSITGRLDFLGRDLLTLSEKEMRALRGDEISMIFQEPMTSLNPLHPVGKQIAENLMRHRGVSKAQAREQVISLMTRTGISQPAQRFRQYPFQMSGGMCQRAMISMALACGPRLLIADEPTTALDVTIQAQILDLMKQIKDESGDMSIILITHDLGVVAEMCDRVIVMYAGQAMESGDCRALLSDPLHPYTRGLLQAIPRIGDREELKAIPGTVPGPDDMPKGCPFYPRCSQALEPCEHRSPPLLHMENGREIRCWLYAGGEAAS